MTERRHLVLVGLMGAGKTTVGRACAHRLGREFVDTDELVEASTGATVRELFTEAGEEAFRALERRAVADASSSPTPLVIACGGGAVLDPANRAALRARGAVVWLQAEPETLGRRVAGSGARPLLDGEPPVATLERLATMRRAAYEAVADAVVDTEGRTADEVADAVLARLADMEGGR